MREQSRGIRRRWKAREKIKSAVGTKSPARGETRLRADRGTISNGDELLIPADAVTTPLAGMNFGAQR